MRNANEYTIKALKSIVDTGACGVTPPIFGFLLRENVITATGFDMEKAKQLLAKLEETTPTEGE